jgi:iron(III) transport system ATP-binding protein
VYRRPVCKTVANFIGETDFIPGKVVSSAQGRASVETVLGRFEGVLGDAQAAPATGAAVTLSIRPECWTLGREAPARNGVQGRIGEAVYLGEMAQYDFVAGGQHLKILEVNPQFLEQSTRGDVYASAEPECVVVLAE